MDQRAQGEAGTTRPSSPKPLLINLLPSVFQADPGSPLTALDFSVRWASQKNWQKIKLEAFIRVSLKITEIEVSFHPLQRASDMQEFQGKLHFKKHVQRCHSAPGYSSALTEAGEPLLTLTQAEGLQQWPLVAASSPWRAPEGGNPVVCSKVRPDFNTHTFAPQKQVSIQHGRTKGVFSTKLTAFLLYLRCLLGDDIFWQMGFLLI